MSLGSYKFDFHREALNLRKGNVKEAGRSAALLCTRALSQDEFKHLVDDGAIPALARLLDQKKTGIQAAASGELMIDARPAILV